MSVMDARLRDALDDTSVAFDRIKNCASMVEMMIDASGSNSGVIDEFYTMAAAIRHFAKEGNACLDRAAELARRSTTDS